MDFSFISDWLNSFETGTIALAVGTCGWLCALICAFLKVPEDGSSTFYKVFYKVMNWIAWNVGNAKNAIATSSTDSTDDSTEES